MTVSRLKVILLLSVLVQFKIYFVNNITEDLGIRNCNYALFFGPPCIRFKRYSNKDTI